MEPFYVNPLVVLYQVDCRECLKILPDNYVDAVVTDPPYALTQVSRGKSLRQPGPGPYGRHAVGTRGFMGLPWDNGELTFDPAFWAEVLRVLKPGGHLLAAGIGRTHHRMMVAVEDAGFEIRDCIYHIFGSGFPKNLDVSKAIDRLKGAEREVVGRYVPPSGVPWSLRQADDPSVPGSGGMFTASGRRTLAVTAPATEEAKRWLGWGTSLKPAVEIWALARKPLSERNVAENVLRWGTGALNIDGCRIAWGSIPRVGEPGWGGKHKQLGFLGGGRGAERMPPSPLGRWPANLVLSHTEDCVFKGFKRVKGITGGIGEASRKASSVFGWRLNPTGGYADADGMEVVEDWECAPGCPVRLLDEQSGELKSGFMKAGTVRSNLCGYRGAVPAVVLHDTYGDRGGASRFFYCAKVSRSERWGWCRECGMVIPPGELAGHRAQGHSIVIHPTQKPLQLMRWLVRLVTPPGGLVLDPFAGSGTTLVAALLEGFACIGVEREKEYAAIAVERLKNVWGRTEERFAPDTNVRIQEPDGKVVQLTLF